jgi:hypothetical protein
MRALASLVVTLALLAVVAPAHAPAPIDRQATIAPASDDTGAPPLRDALVAVTPVLLPHAPLAFVAALPLAPRHAPTAALPLYLRDRALLL